MPRGNEPDAGHGAAASAPAAGSHPPPGSTVFISYASQDAAVANAVVAAVEREGLKCWIAPRDVTPGAFYANEIVRAIDLTKVLDRAILRASR